MISKIEWIKNNDDLANEMIKKANFMAHQYLTPESITAYTIETLLKYADLQNLSLTPQQKELIKKGEDIENVLLNKNSLIMKVASVFYFLFTFLLLLAIYYFLNKKKKSFEIIKIS